MAAKDKKPLLKLSDCETYARARFTTYPGCSESQLAKYKREHGIAPEWIYAGKVDDALPAAPATCPSTNKTQPKQSEEARPRRATTPAWPL